VTGGNLRLVISGSAPLTPDVQSFVRSVLGCPVVQGYGLTETCAGCSVAPPDDVDCVGEVGPMIPCAEVKLVSCPELNYLAKDNKGEVWIRGNNICKGYYKDEEKTKEDFDADGWFHTGDIGAFTERGTLKIIDRKKNIFKLSQGEYVAAEVLENIYLKHPFIDQIWVHGDSTQSTLVAIINVNQKNCMDWAEKNGALPKGDNPIKELIKDERMKKAILQALSDMARAEKRAGYEVIKRCHLIDYEFSAENDFATPTAKLKRPQLRAAFKAEIDSMYKEIAEEENAKSGAPAAATKGGDKGKAKDDGKAAKGKAAAKGGDKPAAAAAEPAKKAADKGKKKEESSEETSDDSSSSAAPAKKAAAASPKKKPADSESDGDVPTSSEDSEPAKKAAAPAKAAPAKKAAESSSDSDSESSSEEKKPAKKAAAPAKKAAESSSDSDSESSSEETKPAKKATTPAKAPAKKAAESSSDSDSESSSEEKKPAKKAAAPAKAPAKKAESSSDSDSSSSSDEKPAKKATTPAKAPAKKVVESSSDSESSSEEKPAKKAPAKKK
jgi:hypothetical protein